MKYTGRKIRVYQDGELITHEFSLSYSESLEFVAIGIYQDSEIDLNKSKRIEIWHNETKILMSFEFKHVDVISNADIDALANDLLIFHNGDIKLVLDYLRLDAVDSVNNRIRSLERAIKDERSKLSYKNLTKKDEHGLYIHADNYHQKRDEIIGFEQYCDKKQLGKIPMWIRQIFKAV